MSDSTNSILKARDVYETYWKSYFKGDIKTFSGILDDNFEMIGTSESEVCHSKSSGIEFLKSQIAETLGKSEMRNRQIEVVQVDSLVLINEHCDIHVLVDSNWTFYSKIRISTWLRDTSEGWKVVQQHGSLPDMRVQEGETIAFERISKENIELRDAIIRRTKDLEEKNRALEVEAALERVRSTSLAMHTTQDLSKVVHVVFTELVKLDAKLDRCLILTVNPQTLGINWYLTGKEGLLSNNGFLVPDNPHPSHQAYLEGWRTKRKKWRYLLAGEEKKLTDAFLFSNTELAQLPAFIKADMTAVESIHLTISSGDFGSLIASSLSPLSEAHAEIVDRFTTVFNQTYTRFLDLQKAEAQAREAQIEAALEKVRSRSLAMHKSNELNEVVAVLFEKLKDLQIPFTAVGIATNIEGSKDLNAFVCGQNEAGLVITNYRLPYFDNPVPKDLYGAIEKQLDYFVGHYSKEEKDSFYSYVLENTAEFRHLPEDIKRMIFDSNTYSITMVAVKNAVFNINDFEGKVLAESEIDIIKRFARVFDQAYTRFLDLQKAEAQAREAQIEAALERVRAKTMAMHKSEHLPETAQVLFEQFAELGKIPDRIAIGIIKEELQVIEWWVTDQMGSQLTTHFNSSVLQPTIEQFFTAWKEGKDSIMVDLSGEALKEWVAFVRDEVKMPIDDSNMKGRRVHHGAFFSQGLLLISAHEPMPHETLQLLVRFAKVFSQTYTRFLDLQKAEAQAREAQIEAALERVRSRTMAMQSSAELGAVAAELFAQMNQLVINLWTCGFVLCEKDRDEDEWWLSMDGDFTRGFFLPNVGDYAHATLYEGWLKGEALRAVQLDGELLQQHYDWLMEIPVSRAIFEEMDAAGLARPEWQKLHAAYFSKGYLVLITRELCGEEEIFRRFAQVFDQTYTRFLDLQKAEAQTREAKIEGALEKVRSRTMGMQSSEELPEVANLLFTEVRALGIHAWSCGYNILAEDKNSATCCMSSEGTLQTPFQLRLWGETSFDEMGDFIRSEKTMLVQELGDQALVEHYIYMKSFPDLKPTFDVIDRLGLSLPTYQINHLCKFTQGFILFITYEKVPEAHEIFKRFTKVFDQTYIRFLDLKKAEAQVKEAKIETALEKVRSRTMAMQHSSELSETSALLFQQIQLLGVPPWSCGFNIWDQGDTVFTSYMGSPDGTILDGFKIPLTEEATFIHFQESRDRGDKLFIDVLEGETLDEHYRYFYTLPGIKEAFEKRAEDGHQRPTFQINHLANFSHGNLMFITYEPCPDAHDIFIRFAKVFEQTYTRFLDLEKAEAQAREAQIEAALERVRSRSMAMHQTDELQEVVRVVAEELKNTGVILDTWGAVICTYFQDSKDVLHWTASEDPSNPSIGFLLPYFKDELYDEAWASKNRGDSYFAKVFSFDVKNNFFKHAFEHSDYRLLPDDYKKLILESENHGIAWAWSKNSAIMIPSIQGDLPSENEKEILIRFAKVFEQSFIRFLDLQKAETQKRESQIQLSLERVRAKTMAMQKSEELIDAASLLFEQLDLLGVTHERINIGIVNEENGTIDFWITEQGGNKLNNQFSGRIDEPTTLSKAYDAWKNGLKTLVVDLQGYDLKNWLRYLEKEIKIPFNPSYHHDRRVQTAGFFTNGMLVVTSPEPLQDEALYLLEKFAGVFDLTYTRFNDLKRAEAQARQAELDLIEIKQARKKAEEALTKLKATQSQLIQQEKLASLGQLTAGIAHEIKNPLNFVNNFSEVSIEMMDEAFEGITHMDTNTQEIVEILTDIKSNLLKIHEHGSRANSIVTSMLQHSRGGSGSIELTNLNALVKEYVNLCFHGMRASKNPINVSLNLDLDPKLKEVPLIKEDFSRVVINLCNNAFDAMRFKTLSGDAEEYLPTLSVKTKQLKDIVIISIQDNGPGIPEDIRDKILQPFFTTKKGTEGTGLGLSITHDIVKAHGGELTLESKEGVGSEFTIKIPIA